MVKPKQIRNFQKFTENTSVLGVLKALEGHGFEAYLAGGAVRDILLDRQPYDFDIATNAKPKDVKKLFPRHTTRGEAFGTIAVQLENGHNFEITTYRSEDVYTNSRHPDQIKFSDSVLQDSMRRDFTINAMYVDFRGVLLDPQNGLKDLELKKIKTVGDAEERFQEDALRVLRAFRFVSQLGFTMDPEEQQVAISLWSNLSKVSSERIYVEIKKMILGTYFFEVLPLILKFNLFEYFVETNMFKKSKFTDLQIETYLVDRLTSNFEKSCTSQLKSDFLKQEFSTPSSKVDLITSNFYGLEEFFLEYTFLKTPSFDLFLKSWISFLPFRKNEKTKMENVVHWFTFIDRLGQKTISDQTKRSQQFQSDVGLILRLGLECFDLKDLKLFMNKDFLNLFGLNPSFIDLCLNKLNELKLKPHALVQSKVLIDLGVKPGPELRLLINKAYELQLFEPELNSAEITDLLGLKN